MVIREKDLIDEIHERRTALLAKFNNDLASYIAYLQDREKSHPERIVGQLKIVKEEKSAVLR